MSLGGIDSFQATVGDVLRQLLLLGEREKPVGFDAQHQSGLLDQSQRLGDGVCPTPRNVVRVQLARHGDVAVAVEALDELGALVAQVRLRREVGRLRRHDVAAGEAATGLLRAVKLGVGLGFGFLGGVAGGDGRGDGGGSGSGVHGSGKAGAVGAVGARQAGALHLVAVVVDVEVRFRRGGRGGSPLPDDLPARRVGSVAAEAGLERVAAPVGQEGGHAGGSETGDGRVLEGVVAVVILGVGVDGLALRLTPADAPGAVPARRGDGNDAAHVVLAEVGPFENKHAAKRTADDGRHLLHAQVVKEQFVKPDIVPDGGQGKLGAVTTFAWIVVLGGDGTGGTIRTSQTVATYDEEAREVEGPTRSAQERTPPVTHIGAASQGVADDHGIVTVGIECAPGGVGHRDVVKRDTRL